MRVLAFDGRMGASGDMLLGALLAAGADRDVLVPVEDALGVTYRVREETKNGISATAVDVLLGDESPENGDHDPLADGDQDEPGDHDHDEPGDHDHDEPGDHDHGGSGDHDHDDSAGSDHDGSAGSDHDDSGDHDHGGEHAEGAGPTRSYEEVLEILSGIPLPDGVRADARAVFTLLGEAEAAVHGTGLEGTHFHEVGADDAIADVVGAALLLRDLGPDRIVTTPLAVGGGEVHMSHGRYPVPAPAVVEIAERADWEIRGGPVEIELLTPTGAAILAHYADGVEALPPLSVSSSGYGAGRADLPEHPNVLRALVGDGAGGLARDEIAVLETNLDDASPEVLGGLQEALFEVGARDVSILPTTTKKSRPGHLVTVVVKPEDAERVALRLARETGTLGVRQTGASHRLVAERRFATTALSIGGDRHEVAVKIGSTVDGTPFDVSAEYDDAAAVAAETGIPVAEAIGRAEAAARQGGALDPVLVHVVEAEDWRAVEEGGAFAPASLDEEGFVHLAPVERAPAVAQSAYPDATEPLLLVVDRDRVDADLRFEETPAGAFPHLYAELDAAAVLDALPFPREDGRYVLPGSLREG